MSLAGADLVTLDPSEVATGRTALPLTGAIEVREANYGNAEVEQYLATRRYGETPYGYRIPNRTVEYALRIAAAGTVGVGAAVRNLQRKVARFQEEGGWLGRTLSPRAAGEYGTDALYADVVDAALALPADWMAQRQETYLDAALTLTTLPDFYGAEAAAGSANSASPHDSISLLGTIGGDYAARSRYTITDTGAQARGMVVIGTQSRTYDAAATAALAYEAEALTPLDLSTRTAVAGAHGGTVVRNTSISPSWTPLLSTEHAASGHLTHWGSYRLLVRCYAADDAEIRAEYSVGDDAMRRVNDPVAIPGAATTTFYIRDLGEIRLPKAPIGTQRWQGQIAASSSVATTVGIDKVWLVPTESISIAKARRDPDAAYSPSIYVARCTFSGTAGTATGRTLDVGGTWAPAGDATDYDYTGSGAMTRTAVSDTADLGRWLVAGTTVSTSVTVQVSVKWSLSLATLCQYGIIARYNSTTEYARLVLSSEGTLAFAARSGGSWHGLEYTKSAYLAVPNLYYTIRLTIADTGRWSAWIWAGTATEPSGPPILSGAHSILAGGGALDDGRSGIYDERSGSTAVTRTYDNFSAVTPTADGAVLSGKSLSLRHDGAWRESASSGIYAPTHVEGGYPRDPVAGIDGRTARSIIIASGGDLDYEVPDTVAAFTATRHYRPTYLFVPEG